MEQVNKSGFHILVFREHAENLVMFFFFFFAPGLSIDFNRLSYV